MMRMRMMNIPDTSQPPRARITQNINEELHIRGAYVIFSPILLNGFRINPDGSE